MKRVRTTALQISILVNTLRSEDSYVIFRLEFTGVYFYYKGLKIVYDV